jgi:hypothetical protein
VTGDIAIANCKRENKTHTLAATILKELIVKIETRGRLATPRDPCKHLARVLLRKTKKRHTLTLAQYANGCTVKI